MDYGEMFERQPEAFETERKMDESDTVIVKVNDTEYAIDVEVTNYTPEGYDLEECWGAPVRRPIPSEIELKINAVWYWDSELRLTDDESSVLEDNDNFMRRLEDAAEERYLEDDGYDG